MTSYTLDWYQVYRNIVRINLKNIFSLCNITLARKISLVVFGGYIIHLIYGPEGKS